MRNLLYAAVHTTEYGADAILFDWPATGAQPTPPSDPVKLAELLGLKFFNPEIESLTAALVKNPTFQHDDEYYDRNSPVDERRT